jgi:hypothetical protein
LSSENVDLHIDGIIILVYVHTGHVKLEHRPENITASLSESQSPQLHAKLDCLAVPKFFSSIMRFHQFISLL